MNKFMIDILLQGIDNETRLKLLPKEQETIKEWEDNSFLYKRRYCRNLPGISGQ